MNQDSFRSRNRLHLVAIVILVTGLVAAGVAFITSAPPSNGEAGSYQIIDGQAYPIDSTREMQQLERLGGKASVQTFKFQQWFASLWQGRPLAYTLLVLSAALAWLCWHLAGLMEEAA